jgi:hypothetical protein
MKDSMLQLCLSSSIIEKDLSFSDMTDDHGKHQELKEFIASSEAVKFFLQ